jgi:hypothetical protein
MSDLTDWAAISISLVALAYGISEARQTRAHNRLSVAPRFMREAAVNEVLAVNTQVGLISVPIGVWSAERSSNIRAAFRKLRFEIDYQSLYREKPVTFVLDGAEIYPDELQGVPNAQLPAELQD